MHLSKLPRHVPKRHVGTMRNHIFFNRLHLPCQTGHEHSHNIDMGLHKYCFCCCAGKMKESSESNFEKNASQRNSSRRLKDDRVHNDESSTTHLRDSAVEDRSITDGKNLSQILIPGTKESNVIDLELNSGAKVSQSQPAERSKDAGSTAGNNRSKIIN